MNSSTIQDEKYWATRDDNWPESYWRIKNHPHRAFQLDAIKTLYPFKSVLDVGCASGGAIAVIKDRFNLKDVNLAGVDVSERAIAWAKDYQPDIDFQVSDVSWLPFSNDSFDVVLTDACLIYVNPQKIRQAIKELSRVSKMGIVLLEWHDEESIDGVSKDGHWARNYTKLLEELGYKVTTRKITEEVWPDAPSWAMHGMVYIAQAPLKTSETN